jgi:hypothetical protein
MMAQGGESIGFGFSLEWTKRNACYSAWMTGKKRREMGDFLAHLVDAPLPNVLVLAGLIFLGIGVVGKVSGKIDPGTTGRIT